MPEELNKSLFYFPAYEMVMNAFANPWREDLRHPRSYVIETIMKCFEAIYCINETSMADANTRYQAARRENLMDMAKQAKLLKMASSPDDLAAQARLAERAARKAAKMAAKKAEAKEVMSDEARAAKRAMRKAQKQAA
jgi:cbb3-type cytochrome oxidase cytochrome c subunit